MRLRHKQNSEQRLDLQSKQQTGMGSNGKVWDESLSSNRGWDIQGVDKLMKHMNVTVIY